MVSGTKGPRKTEISCKSIFKNPDDISSSINKTWAEIISILEDMQRHTYPNSGEFEVSDQ